MESPEICRYQLQAWAKYAKAAGYLAPLQALASDDVLLIEPDVGEIIREAIPNLSCRLVDPSSNSVGFTGVGTTIVLVLKHEFQLVRKLRKMAPDARILSFVYDIVPRIKLKANALAPWEAPGRLDAPKIGILLSSPFSEAEWFSQVLAGAGLAQPIEYLDRAMMLLLKFSEGFLPFRYFAAIHQQLEAKDAMEIHMHSDALACIFASAWVSPCRLVDRVWSMKPAVLYFIRRDKFAQASVALTKIQYKELPSLVFAQDDTGKCPVEELDAFSILHEILLQEAQLEKQILTGDEEFRFVTYEELIDNPLPVLRNIFAFKRRRLPNIVEIPELKDAYLEDESLRSRAKSLRKQLQERICLHENAHGSLTTEFEAFLADEEDVL